jgi:hypothetical protein
MLIMSVINFFYPKKYFVINYKSNTILQCDNNKTFDKKLFQKIKRDNDKITFYHNVYCYDKDKRNTIGSNLLKFDVYDNVFICSRQFSSLQSFQKHCLNIEAWTLPSLDPRLVDLQKIEQPI